jgi:hypothetical protein
VSRLINAKTGPFVDEFATIDCAALDPDLLDACFLATFDGTSGSYAQAWLAFEQSSVSLLLSARGTVSRAGGAATVSGQVTCSDLAYPRPDGTDHAVVTGRLLQRIGRRTVATGTFRTPELRCRDTAVPWTARVVPTGGVPFGSGYAELSAAATIVTAGPWVPTDREVRTVRLVLSR